MTKKEIEEIHNKVMYNHHITCCICQIEGRDINIHHIDGNHSNDDINNLCVLCLLCHNIVHKKGGFGKHLNPGLVTTYRDEWVKRIERKRNGDIPIEQETTETVIPSTTVNVREEELKKGIFDYTDDFTTNMTQLLSVVPFIVEIMQAYESKTNQFAVKMKAAEQKPELARAIMKKFGEDINIINVKMEARVTEFATSGDTVMFSQLNIVRIAAEKELLNYLPTDYYSTIAELKNSLIESKESFSELKTSVDFGKGFEAKLNRALSKLQSILGNFVSVISKYIEVADEILNLLC